MRKFIILAISLIVLVGVAIPKAKAMDPITIAILAPYAIPVAEVAGQWALKGLVNAAKGLPDIGRDMLELFLLPLGFLEITLGAPFGLFANGCSNIGAGCIAPFRLCFSTIMLVPRLLCLYDSTPLMSSKK
ncbi:MAG TPA: hypothetical protein DET40_14855 [Lentisphaeria bacterium]|nr:MAG: hypothetical protein A2X45_06130 [Lentisphaerae bacterium GWF2_50_93]HCE44817.1 hypothetical protein [Lentisphaeria bacterium]